jgi:hypothetical protein
MRGFEIRNLRLRNMGLSASGVRTIALSADASEAQNPEHQLIPVSVRKDRARFYDSAAAKGWRMAWRKLTIEAARKGLRVKSE